MTKRALAEPPMRPQPPDAGGNEVNEPRNGFSYRLAALERRLARLEDLEPAVVKSQLADVKDDIHQLSQDLASIRKILTGFLVTFAFTGITIVISVVLLTQDMG